MRRWDLFVPAQEATATLLNFKRWPGRRPSRTECKTTRSHLHFVMQLLEAAVLPWHGELGALQDRLTAGHVAVDLREVHVEPERGRQTNTKHAHIQANAQRVIVEREKKKQLKLIPRRAFQRSSTLDGCRSISPVASSVVDVADPSGWRTADSLTRQKASSWIGGTVTTLSSHFYIYFSSQNYRRGERRKISILLQASSNSAMTIFLH